MVEEHHIQHLREFHCSHCGRLLCKGVLLHRDSMLEVKCRSCRTVEIFHGESARIIELRSELIRRGLLPDTDPR